MIWRRVLYHVNIHQSHNIPWQLLNTLKVYQASSYSSSFTGITNQIKKGSNSFLPKLLRTDLSLIPQLGCISDRDNVYIYDKNQQTSHSTIIKLSYDLHGTIRDTLREGNVTEKVPRIAFLCDNDMFYVVTQLAIWLCGGIGVPLCKTHPESEWKYVMENSKCSAVVKSMKTSLPVSNVPVIDLSHKSLHHWIKDCRGDRFHVVQNVPSADDPALIIYTSGTTGPPKGVMLSHRNLITNINDMIMSWEWNRRKQDTILHCLPLHHVHGVVNALWTPIFCGANVVMLPKFNASVVWKILTKAAVEDFSKEDIENLQFHPTSLLVNLSMINITVFMGVPTIYVKLIEYFDQISGTGSKREGTSDSSCISHRNFNHIRLMVSGSAALRKDVMKKWKEISDHDLLERYGMTEIGMALTNPLHGEKTPGAVGNPFHSVEVKIARENKNSEFGYDTLCVGNHECTIVKEGLEEVKGELLVKGEGVFKEYYENLKATTESFTKDDWFKTGDTAEFKDGVYRILGRSSVDIIKSGGYKISALDIEAILFTHSDIIDCAVVGVDDLVWGQRVAAVIVLNSKDTNMTLQNLQNWCKGKMPDYKIPSVLQVVEELPKNAMGKIEKKKIAKLYFD